MTAPAPTITVTIRQLTEAVHLVRHERARLWPVTAGCGCEEFAGTVWDHVVLDPVPVTAPAEDDSDPQYTAYLDPGRFDD